MTELTAWADFDDEEYEEDEELDEDGEDIDE
jgi:hypothetical protein